MIPDDRILDAVLRNDFRAFIHKVFNTLSPGQDYVRNWHIDALAWQLERVRLGKDRRVIVNMPPRALKSITASVALPAFILGHDPTRRLVCVSYSIELAKKHSNDFRAIIESSWYRRIFPNTKIGRYKNSETEIEFTRRGYRLAASVGGTLTGRGGELVIIDDPLKPDDALSEAKRSGTNNWFGSTLLSRLDDKRTGSIVIVMQRVHMDDLAGSVLRQSNDWKVLSLPAIATCDQRIPIAQGRVYCRTAGEVLSPREPVEILEAMKRQIGSDAFSAQYQQEPVPPGGAMIKRQWVKQYDELPPYDQRLYVVQSWDTAMKGGPDNDWSVCTTWMFTKKLSWYLMDVWRQRVDYPTLKAKVLELAKIHRAHRVLIEDTGAGTSLSQELRGRINVIPIKPEGDKVSRMSVASARIEAGSVFLPQRAPWLADLESELFSFPGGRHDDQFDSISQALQHGCGGMFWITPEVLEMARRPGPYTRFNLAHSVQRIPCFFLSRGS